MNSARLVNWTLPVVITLLAVADGALHFALDVVLFRGNFIGRLGPPPGTTPAPNPPPGPPVPLPLQVNQLFLLNLLGYLVLVGLLWFALRQRPSWRVWVNLALMLYAAAAFLAWIDYGRPNPMNLGLLSKTVEVVLLIALIVHTRLLSRPAPSASSRLELQSHTRR